MGEASSAGAKLSLDDVCERLDHGLRQSDDLIASLRDFDLKTPKERQAQSRALRQKLRVCESLAEALHDSLMADPSSVRAQDLLRRFVEDYVHPDERVTWAGYPAVAFGSKGVRERMAELA